MLQDKKILITGPAGQIAFPLAAYLAKDNDVWGIARFSEDGSRDRVDASGSRRGWSISASATSATARRLHLRAAPRGVPRPAPDYDRRSVSTPRGRAWSCSTAARRKRRWS